jgi:hypothetical protein
VAGASAGTSGVAGTAAVDEHAASSNITLQLKTTIRFNMNLSPSRRIVAAFVLSFYGHHMPVPSKTPPSSGEF